MHLNSRAWTPDFQISRYRDIACARYPDVQMWEHSSAFQLEGWIDVTALIFQDSPVQVEYIFHYEAPADSFKVRIPTLKVQIKDTPSPQVPYHLKDMGWFFLESTICTGPTSNDGMNFIVGRRWSHPAPGVFNVFFFWLVRYIVCHGLLPVVNKKKLLQDRVCNNDMP